MCSHPQQNVKLGSFNVVVVQRPQRNVQKRCDVNAMKFWVDGVRDKRDRAVTCVFCRDLHSILFFLVFYKYTCLKEGEVWRNVYSNKIIVTLVTEGLPMSSFLSLPVGYVHYYPGMILSYLIALTFSILAYNSS